MKKLLAWSVVAVGVLCLPAQTPAATSQPLAMKGVLVASLSALPAATVVAPHKVLRATAVSQAEAEILFATSDAAVYIPDTGEVLSLVSGDPTPAINAVASGAKAHPGSGLSAGSSPGPIGSRIQALGESSLAEFAVLAERTLGETGVRSGDNWLVKFPSAKTRPAGGAQANGTSLSVRKMDSTGYYLLEDFEGDVWSRWTRGDNTGGKYQWAVKSCTALSGTYSGDPVRGGSQGAYLACSANYPPSVETWMYYTLCDTIPTDWAAWGSLYLTGTIGTGTDNYFGIYASDPAGHRYGYSFWGTWQGWFKISANLRQWYYLGDLGQYACNYLYLDFSSSASAPAGSGPKVDDVQIDVGPAASTYGQCQIFADPVVGKAPLTVSFRGVTDLIYGSFKWWFGDGSTSTVKDPVHTFITAGAYEVEFQAEYDNVRGFANATVTVQPGAVCSYSLSATSQSFAAGSGTGTVGVITAANCVWTANSNANWITITSGATGTGNGSVGYSVQANTGAARTGTLTIAGQTFTVYQDALACTYSLGASTANYTASGGSGTVSVTTPAGCPWTAVSSASWVTITSGASGTGSGVVGYLVAANSGAFRSGTLTIAGQTFTVYQGAATCTYSLGASTANYTASGGSGTVSVTTPAVCPWTAATESTWIHITNNSGTGSGIISYSVDANPGPARSGDITVQSQTLTVNQDATTAPIFSHWLPAVIHKDVPSRNAWWRSDVAVLNRSPQTTNLTLKIYAPSGTRTSTIQLAGNAQALLRDVAGQLQITDESGALEVVSDQDVFLTGRTYSQVDATHTYGQDYDGQSSDALLFANQSAWLLQLTQNALFRTNIGITNTGTASANVTVTLYDSAGNQVWADTRDYGPGQFVQHDQPYSQTATGEIDAGYAKVTVNSGSGIAAYASVIDQQTGDPTTVNMKR